MKVFKSGASYSDKYSVNRSFDTKDISVLNEIIDFLTAWAIWKNHPADLNLGISLPQSILAHSSKEFSEAYPELIVFILKILPRVKIQEIKFLEGTQAKLLIHPTSSETNHE